MSSDFYTGAHTTLDDFLGNFSSTDGAYVRQLDPLTTFDVKFSFYPKRSANNYEAFSWWPNSQAENSENKLTFLKSLSDSMLLSDKTPASDQFELDLTFYVQSITIPQIRMSGQSDVDIPFIGTFPTIGTFCVPDSNILTMTVLTTTVPLHERLFYPWLKEVTLPYWVYDNQPYTTATVVVDFSRHSDVKYVFTGVRPQQIDTIQPSQSSGNQSSITRSVSFMFDYMFISSSFAVTDSNALNIAKQGGTILNSHL